MSQENQTLTNDELIRKLYKLLQRATTFLYSPIAFLPNRELQGIQQSVADEIASATHDLYDHVEPFLTEEDEDEED